MQLSVVVLLFCVAALIPENRAYVFSCNEILNDLLNLPSSYGSDHYACVAVQKQNADTFFTRNILLTDTVSNHSLHDLSTQAPNCLKSTKPWKVVSNYRAYDFECSSEISILLSTVALSYHVAEEQLTYLTVSAGKTVTIASPAGGIRLERLRCKTGSGTSHIQFFSGAGGTVGTEIFDIVDYNCLELPYVYVTFDNALQIKVDAMSSLEFYFTSIYQVGYELAPDSKIAVTSSGQSDFVQRVKGDQNFATFQVSTPVFAGISAVQISPSGNAQLKITNYGTKNDTQTASGTVFNYSFNSTTYFGVNYYITPSSSSVWRSQDMINVQIQLGDAAKTSTVASTSHSTVTTTSHTTVSTPKTTTRPSTTPTTSTPDTPYADKNYCTCQDNKTWVDVVFLTDSSSFMLKNGLDYVVAMIQSTIAQINLDPTVDDKHYSRVAIIQYNDTVKKLYDFGSITKVQDVIDIHIPLMGGEDVDLASAVEAALKVFNDHAIGTRRLTRRVIVISTAIFNSRRDDYKGISEFKEQGGTVITLNFVQNGEAAQPNLCSELATPGYCYYNSNFTHLDLTSSFCDINCFCAPDLIPYVVPSDMIRRIPTGGCYNIVNLAAIEPAAQYACVKQKSNLASVHSADKQFFLMTQFSNKAKYWLGVQRKSLNDPFTWIDNSSAPYVNWNTNEPSTAGNCVYSQQTTGFSSAWFTTDCNSNAFVYPCQARPCDSTYYCYENN